MSIAGLRPGSGAHPIGWLELSTTDSAGFRHFYRSLFGWRFEDYLEDYFFYQTTRGLEGGVRVNPPAGSPPATCYLYVPDIDAALTRIQAAGGEKVVDKMKVTEEGSIAFYKDLSGIIVGLADMPMPQDYEPAPLVSSAGLEPGSIVHLEIYGGSLRDTDRFYSELFGWSCMATRPDCLAFNTGAGISGIFQSHSPQAHVMAYVWVEDVAATLTRAVELGATALGEPIVLPGTPVFGYFLDPYGCAFGLMGPPE